MNNRGNLINLTVLIYILLTGCSRNKAGDSIPVNLDEITIESINYSEFIDSISYIQLNIPEDKPIAEINTLKFADSLLIAFDRVAQRVMTFTNDGRYIRDIGSRGSGHGEYINCRQIDLDKDENQILIYDIAKSAVIRYNFDGDYLYSDSIGRADDIAHIGKRHFLAANNNESNDELSGIFYVSPAPFSRTKIRSCRDNVALNKPFEFFDRDNHKSIMTRSFEDTILLWENDSLATCVKFNIAQNPSGRQIKEFDKDPFKRNEYPDRVYFFDYDNLILIYYRYKNDNRYLLYDKNDRNIRITTDLDNDIDGVYGSRLPVSHNNTVASFVSNNDSLPPRIQFLHLK